MTGDRQELERFRRIVAGALQTSSAPGARSPEIVARLADPAADVSFDEAGADSLARMEVCIRIELETGLSLSTEELLAHPSVKRLARHVQTLLAVQR